MNINYIKQPYVCCGNPSPEGINLLRTIVEKKLKLEKNVGIYIHRKEVVRNIINSDDFFELLKQKYNNMK